MVYEIKVVLHKPFPPRLDRVECAPEQAQKISLELERLKEEKRIAEYSIVSQGTWDVERYYDAVIAELCLLPRKG